MDFLLIELVIFGLNYPQKHKIYNLIFLLFKLLFLFYNNLRFLYFYFNFFNDINVNFSMIFRNFNHKNI
jgi:hypothetical protein